MSVDIKYTLCPQCDATIHEDDNYCRYCGLHLNHDLNYLMEIHNKAITDKWLVSEVLRELRNTISNDEPYWYCSGCSLIKHQSKFVSSGICKNCATS